MALLTPDTCESQIGGTDRLAKLDGGQVERLERACDEAEARVRHAAEDRLPAPELNAAAGDAWRRYQIVLDRTLRPEQRARLDAILGHMRMDGEAHGHGP
ncbi:MAG: hypothetical protein ABR599_12985 [Gemmatimonadota bacterium]